MSLELQEVHSFREKARARQRFHQGDNSPHMCSSVGICEKGLHQAFGFPIRWRLGSTGPESCGFCLSDPSSLVRFSPTNCAALTGHRNVLGLVSMIFFSIFLAQLSGSSFFRLRLRPLMILYLYREIIV
ncbi:hypothetical protein V6N13_084960 [Hibiscus sabdariffa]